jgi:hypothetical protein
MSTTKSGHLVFVTSCAIERETEEVSVKRNINLFILMHLGVSNRGNAINLIAGISTAKCLLKNAKSPW